MPGGLLNLIAVGQQDIILNGNPKKTFWKTSYSKYTNFGMQKFRLDFNGMRKLRLNDSSKFTFKFPRYGDLVMDSYLVINLPHFLHILYSVFKYIFVLFLGKILVVYIVVIFFLIKL